MNHKSTREKHLADVCHLAIDMDGTIYRGETLFPFTRPFLRRLSELGIGYTFFTNNSSKSVKEHVRYLAKIGIEATEPEIYTSTLATIAYLQERYPECRRLYILGTESMVEEFEANGYVFCLENPDLVVVGFDPLLCFERLGRAGYWIREGRPFVATHPDRTCPTDQPTLLVDCGSICAALTAATGRLPDAVLGKPHPIMIDDILVRNGLARSDLAVVGDRLNTDVAMAQAVGAFAILVLTGETTKKAADAASAPPDLILPSLEDLAGLLADARAVKPLHSRFNASQEL